jgi:branched-chain amino acid transport system substrate-binding protein
VPTHCSMGFNNTWILLDKVLPIATGKYGGFDAEAVRKAALEVDVPLGGTLQGYGVKFLPPDDAMAGQNERALPVVMQNHGKEITVVWPTEIQTQAPVLPLPSSSPYAMG